MITAGGPTVCHAGAGPGICDETILSRQNCEISARGLSPDARNICANGPVVGLVAVCVRVGMCFCKVPIDGRKFSRPGEVVQMAKSR
jgi:hypothetical protein